MAAYDDLVAAQNAFWAASDIANAAILQREAAAQALQDAKRQLATSLEDQYVPTDVSGVPVVEIPVIVTAAPVVEEVVP